MRTSFSVLRVTLVAVIASAAFGAFAQSVNDSSQDIVITGPVAPFVPRSLDSATTTVVVNLAGAPVAVVQKNAGRTLSRAEKDAIITARKSDQAAIRPDIEARGGHVVGAFQSALNGIKVTIARNQVAALKTIPGVVSVKPVGVYSPDNAVSVPFIGAPLVWQSKPSYRGQGIKIAVIDTGIDYTHANFGGPGTVAAFNAAFATSTAPADPALFGDNAPKVKGGIDLVGDNYNANFNDAAHAAVPDPNPLDCNGHGSHTSGTAAGFGVNANGTTYTGQYNASIYTPGAFKIGPGVAPLAQLYAVRVFGCAGSTNVVSEAIDWAVDNNMDVISMSLGSSWGAADNSESDAINNATGAGILVVASSGNSGPVPYIAGSPAASNGAVSVAAMDSTAGFPGASLALTGVPNPILVEDANAAPFANGTSWPIYVLRNTDGTVSLGCNESEYVDATIAGKLVVTLRGTCARILRAQLGFKHGAGAVAMINTAVGYSGLEGDIPALSGTGIVTIPFFSVLASDKATLTGPTGGPAPAAAVATNASIANPGFETAASFSSGGPRYGDSVLKPNVTAPGVSIVSTAVGTGSDGETLSGTSMAAPHVAGVAALVKEANHPWAIDDLRAAVVQTATPSKLVDYTPRIEGAGVVQHSLSFGYADLLQDFSASRQVTVHNNGNKPVTFNVAATKVVGGPTVSVATPSAVTVAARSDANFQVTLNVPAASVGGTHDAIGGYLFEEVGGYVQLVPASPSANNGATLTVPYYLVAHTRSNLAADAATINSVGATNLTLSNTAGALSGTPDFYSLGQSVAAPQHVAYADTRAVGVKAIPAATPANTLLVFAVNTFDRFSNAAPNEWDIYIDTTGSGTPNYVLVGANGSFFTTSASAQNTLVAAVIRLSDGAVTSLRFADAATDNSTVLLSFRASALGGRWVERGDARHRQVQRICPSAGRQLRGRCDSRERFGSRDRHRECGRVGDDAGPRPHDCCA